METETTTKYIKGLITPVEPGSEADLDKNGTGFLANCQFLQSHRDLVYTIPDYAPNVDAVFYWEDSGLESAHWHLHFCIDLEGGRTQEADIQTQFSDMLIAMLLASRGWLLSHGLIVERK